MSDPRDVHAGDRVRMTGVMPGDPDPLPIGSEGTVQWVGTDLGQPFGRQIHVSWDDRRGLILLESDPFQIVEEP